MILKIKNYTLHVKDATTIGGKIIINWSDNQINESIGVYCLQNKALTVDELVDIIKKHFGVK